MAVEPDDTDLTPEDIDRLLDEGEPITVNDYAEPRHHKMWPAFQRHHLLTSKTPKVRMSPLRKR